MENIENRVTQGETYWVKKEPDAQFEPYKARRIEGKVHFHGVGPVFGESFNVDLESLIRTRQSEDGAVILPDILLRKLRADIYEVLRGDVEDVDETFGHKIELFLRKASSCSKERIRLEADRYNVLLRDIRQVA